MLGVAIGRELLSQATGGARLTGTLCHLFWGPMTTVVAEAPRATMTGEQEPPGLQATAVVHLLALHKKGQRQPRLRKASHCRAAPSLPPAQNLREAGQASSSRPECLPSPHSHPRHRGVSLQTQETPSPAVAPPDQEHGSLSQRGAVNRGPSEAPPGQAPPRTLSLLKGAHGRPPSGPGLRPCCRETAWVPASSFSPGVESVVREVRPVCTGPWAQSQRVPWNPGSCSVPRPPCLDFNITSYLHHGPVTAPAVPQPWRKFPNRL